MAPELSASMLPGGSPNPCPRRPLASAGQDREAGSRSYLNRKGATVAVLGWLYCCWG